MIANRSNVIADANFSKACHTLYSPEVMTQLLREAVPVLKACDFQITKVRPGFAETRLPLSHATTNQHGTHQAALISLTADYTGGMALTTAFGGDPLAGIHRCDAGESASLWLVGMDMRYLKPSTGHMIGTCQIDQDLFAKLSKRYRNGQRVLVPLKMEFHSNGDLVATGELKYYAQTTSSLRKSSGNRISSLVEQKLKASARMIAGIRTMVDGPRRISCTSADKNLSMDCENLAHRSAGAHGMLLAEKMKQKLPQLVTFVRSRTQHIDQVIGALDGLQQIVLVGAGLDLRTLLHTQLRPEIATFELDLPEMLAEREKIVEQISSDDKCKPNRTPVECDFVKDSIAKKMLALPNFDPQRKTAFIYEGCSMYFNQDINCKIFTDIKSLMMHDQSVLWSDFVSEEIICNDSADQGVVQFLDAMVELGEKFVFGKANCNKYLDDMGFEVLNVLTTREFLQSNGEMMSDPVYNLYRFCVASRRR